MVGVHPHGSLAWSDYQEGVSDIDVLLVVAGPMAEHDKRSLVSALADLPASDAIGGIDLVVTSRSTVVDPQVRGGEELAYEAFRDHSWQPKYDLEGWGDGSLALAIEIVRVTGSVLFGRAPDYFAPIDPSLLRRKCVAELEWWLAQETITWPRTAILNASRAWRYVTEGVLCSKLVGGSWGRDRLGSAELIDRALVLQRGLDGASISDGEARAFVSMVVDRIDRQPGGAS